MVSRIIENTLIKQIQQGKVIGLFGARRTGKTVLMQTIKEKMKVQNILMVHGENRFYTFQT